MKNSREYKKWVNWMRKRFAKKNGVIPFYCFDDPGMEIKDDKNKRRYKRHIEKRKGIEDEE